MPFLLVFVCAAAFAQAPPAAAPAGPAAQTAARDNMANDQTLKSADDLLWHMKLGEEAEGDKVVYASLPPNNEPNKTAQGAGNPVIIYAYTFIPRKLDRTRKQPFLVYVHGGVHSDLRYAGPAGSPHIIRELLEQGYAIIAPEYRGSTGYGRAYYDLIDYGGRENDDVFAARTWMLETYSFLDPKRVGIVGWSHGGAITLMNIFAHPDAHGAAHAGVPVSDLVARMGHKGDAFRGLFSAHIRKSARGNVQEHPRRSAGAHG